MAAKAGDLGIEYFSSLLTHRLTRDIIVLRTCFSNIAFQRLCNSCKPLNMPRPIERMGHRPRDGALAGPSHPLQDIRSLIRLAALFLGSIQNVNTVSRRQYSSLRCSLELKMVRSSYRNLGGCRSYPLVRFSLKLINVQCGVAGHPKSMTSILTASGS